VLSITLGLRPGDLRKLAWDHVDLDNAVIHVRRKRDHRTAGAGHDRRPGQSSASWLIRTAGLAHPHRRDNGTAVTAYRLSVKAGNALSERKLAQMFGRTFRCWARARIADARQSPKKSQPRSALATGSELGPSLSGAFRS